MHKVELQSLESGGAYSIKEWILWKIFHKSIWYIVVLMIFYTWWDVPLYEFGCTNEMIGTDQHGNQVQINYETQQECPSLHLNEVWMFRWLGVSSNQAGGIGVVPWVIVCKGVLHFILPVE